MIQQLIGLWIYVKDYNSLRYFFNLSIALYIGNSITK